MTIPLLADLLRSGQSLYLGWVGLPEPLVAELVARSGFDAVCLEGQHALHSTSSIMRGIPAIRLGGKPAVVRIPVGDNALASQALDMGAEAIIAPMINTVADAQALVAATKYPPLGERSWGPVRTITLHDVDMATQLATANQSTLALAMIETPTALENLDAILAVDGIDGTFMGPSDLSVTLSQGREINPFSPALDEPIRRIAKRTLAAGKIPCAFAATPERAREFRDIGYRLVAIGSDQAYLAGGMKAVLEAAK
jgi:4-hydroxy-2-oxoheptanedioate aldolase